MQFIDSDSPLSSLESESNHPQIHMVDQIVSFFLANGSNISSKYTLLYPTRNSDLISNLEPWGQVRSIHGVRQSTVEFISRTYFSLLARNVSLLWRTKTISNSFICKVELLEDEPISQQIKKTVNDRFEKVSSYFHHFNRHMIEENWGQFYVNHKDKKITFETINENWLPNMTERKFQVVFAKKVEAIEKDFVWQLEQFIKSLRIIPLAETMQERKARMDLWRMKLLFEFHKRYPEINPETNNKLEKYRENISEPIPLGTKEDFEKMFYILSSDDQSILNNQSIFDMNSREFRALKNEFKTNFERYHRPEQSKKVDQIVLPVEILNKKAIQEVKVQAGFGLLTKGLYTCKFQSTIHQEVNERLRQEMNGQENRSQDEQITEKQLCCKMSKKQDCQSFDNEVQFLLNFRNKKSSHIAQYYCNSGKLGIFGDNKIYMDFYISTMEKLQCKLKKMTALLLQLIKGILFLNRNGVLHRDLKPSNVMADRDFNCRIIDFGSAVDVYGADVDNEKSLIFKHTKLRSTKGYYAEYQDYEKQCKQQMGSKLHKPFDPNRVYSQKEFNQHYYFDVYSFGQIIDEILKLEELRPKGLIENDVVLSTLYYIYRAASQINPADRIGHEEIQFLLEKLIEIN